MEGSGALQAGLKEEQALWNDEELFVNKTGLSRVRCCTRGHNEVKKEKRKEKGRTSGKSTASE